MGRFKIVTNATPITALKIATADWTALIRTYGWKAKFGDLTTDDKIALIRFYGFKWR